MSDKISDSCVDLIFEDKNFLVFDKASGVEFHGDNGLVNLVRSSWPMALGVHRLDKETTGIILFAKTKEVQSKISKLFEERQVQKTYIALSDKKPAKKQGQVKGDIEKTRGGSYKLSRTQVNPSVTKFQSNFFEADHLRGFLLWPKTGKTHQLRVVLKSLKSPILGDSRYKGSESDRMYLHAAKLEFEFEGEKFCFVCLPNSGEYFLKEEVQAYFKTELENS